MRDYENGQLYGLEKFWAFMKYYKHANELHVMPEVKELLTPFTKIEDFKMLYTVSEFVVAISCPCPSPKCSVLGGRDPVPQSVCHVRRCRRLPVQSRHEGAEGEDGVRGRLLGEGGGLRRTGRADRRLLRPSLLGSGGWRQARLGIDDGRLANQETVPRSLRLVTPVSPRRATQTVCFDCTQ